MIERRLVVFKPVRSRRCTARSRGPFAPAAPRLLDADAGRREGPAQLAHLPADSLQDRLVVEARDRLLHPGGDLPHLRLSHAARRDRRRTDADPAGAEGTARIVGDGFVVGYDAGAVQGLGRLLGDDTAVS